MTEYPELTSMRDETRTLVEQLRPLLQTAMDTVDDRPALPAGAEQVLSRLAEALPEHGCGAADALNRLAELNAGAGANTAGPRCYHFVIGGSTPAALAADLLATAYETITYTWVTSPVGVMMELQALDWLKSLFGLPQSWSGIMVTGASMANFVGLAAARQWWGEEHGVDVSEQGLSGLPQMPVLSSGHIHASSRKVLAMLGVGRSSVQACSADHAGRVDLDRFEKGLAALNGAPAVVIVNAGEVNAGEFDPILKMIEIARRHRAWVHVDGAFGLFARLSPRTAHLAEGVEQADSVTVDGHKWLNVPYDTGFAFARDHGLLVRAFRYTADYLPPEDDPRPTLGAIGPESSRRGRSFAVWATLKAYGREGHRQIVEHCLDLARHLAMRVEEAPDFELMAQVPLNIVAFRYRPDERSDEQLDRLNQTLGEAVLADGRFLVGTSRLGARTIFRPAFSNWRTRSEHLDEFLEVLRELGSQA